MGDFLGNNFFKLSGNNVLCGGKYSTIISNGLIVLNGDIVAERIEGTGLFICDGNLLVDTIHISGNLKTRKKIEAKLVDINGSLNGSEHSALYCSEFNVKGEVYLPNIKSDSVLIQKDKFFSIFHQVSEIGRIEAGKVRVENTQSNYIRGNNVLIGTRCKIGTVEYNKSISIHSQSIVKCVIKQ